MFMKNFGGGVLAQSLGNKSDSANTPGGLPLGNADKGKEYGLEKNTLFTNRF